MFSFNNSVFFIYSIAVITIFGKCHSEIQIVKLATTLIVNLLNRRQSRGKKSSSDVFRKERGPWLSWVCNSKHLISQAEIPFLLLLSFLPILTFFLHFFNLCLFYFVLFLFLSKFAQDFCQNKNITFGWKWDS